MNWHMGHSRRAPAPKVEPAPGLVIGATIVTACGKCKARTPHTVIAKVGVKPTRVECSTCKDTHAYKTTPVRRPPAATANMTPEELWTTSMRHAQGVARAYSPTERFDVGARVTHSSFGEGVVARLSSATVCDVVFSTRTVKLVMGPSSSRGDWVGPDRVVSNPRVKRSRRMG